MDNNRQPENRRQWLATCARWLSLGTLATVTAVLGVRRATVPVKDCGLLGPCCDCRQRNSCPDVKSADKEPRR